MPRRSRHLPQRVGQRRTDRKDQNQLEEIRQRIRIFKRMRAIGIEESAAVGPEFLDHFLRSCRAPRNRLFLYDLCRCLSVRAGRLHRLRIHELGGCVRLEILRNALRNQEERAHKAERKQNPQHRARHVHPEIPERVFFAPRDSANHGDGQRDAHGGRNKVVIREGGHLRQIRHRRFRHIGLPVRVRRERSRSVERQVGGNGRQFLRIQRQMILHALDQIRERHGHAAENEHRAGIFFPAHLDRFVHARQPVEQLLERPQHGIEQRLLPVKHARQERAEGLGQRQHHQQKHDDLEPSVVRHGQNFSGRSIAYTR